MGLRKPPLVYTEQGVAMLSSVLNSHRAIMVNIQIIRVFTKIRLFVLTHTEILEKLEEPIWCLKLGEDGNTIPTICIY